MADEDILGAVALALATGAANGLTEAGRAAFAALTGLVRRRFQGRESAQAVLAEVETEAKTADYTRVQALRDELARTVADDPAFDEQLRRHWADLRPHLTVDTGGVVNNLSSSVGGNVVQARDVHGGISFGEAGPRRPEARH
ncbi:hypothetical protein DMB66_32985 [Actinoplanes sp. ATCC 53533]|uniref:hypothetical protein n=1 Tax=Actinoplanes sp. ATCC 53533 TaxID=1288362 RepID=UPI000F7B5746|nr:hypothetical protein [Actinoplanes sp. ATCC 53533]RSM56773.1 hypothetical protein DMB66_32985 [Actinoplanes sp. ATCC 53533]